MSRRAGSARRNRGRPPRRRRCWRAAAAPGTGPAGPRRPPGRVVVGARAGRELVGDPELGDDADGLAGPVAGDEAHHRGGRGNVVCQVLRSSGPPVLSGLPSGEFLSCAICRRRSCRPPFDVGHRRTMWRRGVPSGYRTASSVYRGAAAGSAAWSAGVPRSRSPTPTTAPPRRRHPSTTIANSRRRLLRWAPTHRAAIPRGRPVRPASHGSRTARPDPSG